MATKPQLDPYQQPPPRTGPPVPNMNGFPAPQAAQPRNFVAAAPSVGATRPGPAPMATTSNWQTFQAAPMQTNKPVTSLPNAMQWTTAQMALPQGAPVPGAPPMPTIPAGGYTKPTMPTGPFIPPPQPTLPDMGGHLPPSQSQLPPTSPQQAPAPAPATTTTPAKTGGGGGGAPAVPGQEQKASNSMEAMLNALISGKGGAYSPKAMGSMRSDLLRATQGQLASSTDAINSDAIARGLFRSGVAGRNVATAARGAASDYSSGVRKLFEEKAKSDTQTKLTALGQKQQWLDSLRNAGFQRAQLAQAGRGGPSPEMITVGTNPDGTPKQVSQAQANWMLELMDREVR